MAVTTTTTKNENPIIPEFWTEFLIEKFCSEKNVFIFILCLTMFWDHRLSIPKAMCPIGVHYINNSATVNVLNDDSHQFDHFFITARIYWYKKQQIESPNNILFRLQDVMMAVEPRVTGEPLGR